MAKLTPKMIPVKVTKVSNFAIVVAALLIKRAINVIDRRINHDYYENQMVARIVEALAKSEKVEEAEPEEVVEEDEEKEEES